MLSHETRTAIASWAALSAPTCCREDAKQEAWVGILTAERSYRKGKGTSLHSYTRMKPEYGVQEFLRRNDPLTRRHRQKIENDELPAVCHITYEDVDGFGVQSHEELIVRHISAAAVAYRA